MTQIDQNKIEFARAWRARNIGGKFKNKTKRLISTISEFSEFRYLLFKYFRMDLQSQVNKKRKLKSKKCQISTECDHCKVYVPSEEIWRKSNGTEAQFNCKICNVSVQIIVKPLDVKADENENEIVRNFQENFEFEDSKTEIKDELIDVDPPPLVQVPASPEPSLAQVIVSPVQAPMETNHLSKTASEQVPIPNAEKSYKCKICDNDIDHKDDIKFKLHLVLFHFKDDLLKKYQSDLSCQYCSKDLTSDNALARIIHVGITHTEVVLNEAYEQAVKKKTFNEPPMVQVPASTVQAPMKTNMSKPASGQVPIPDRKRFKKDSEVVNQNKRRKSLKTEEEKLEKTKERNQRNYERNKNQHKCFTCDLAVSSKQALVSKV